MPYLRFKYQESHVWKCAVTLIKSFGSLGVKETIESLTMRLWIGNTLKSDGLACLSLELFFFFFVKQETKLFMSLFGVPPIFFLLIIPFP